MFKEVTVTLRFDLGEGEQEKLAEYVALRRQYDVARFPGKKYPEARYTDGESLRHIFGVMFLDDVLDEAIDREKRILEHRQKLGPVQLGSELDEEAGDVPTRNPSPDEATPDEAAPDEAEPESESVSNTDEAAPDEAEPEPETVCNAEEEAPGDRESEPDGEEDFLSLAPLPCSYPHDPAAQYTPYDPALYENDAYESGGRIVLENPETLAFVDVLSAALCR